MRKFVVSSMLACFFIGSAQAHMRDTTGRDKLPYSDFIMLREGLNNFYKTCLQKHTATAAFPGGSITYNPGWRNNVCSWLTERFPETRFR